MENWSDMDARDAEARWERLALLLDPVHARAVLTARRLTRSAADGDDLLHEAVLRAFEKLHTLRDASRFGSWFYAILLSRHRSRARRWFWRRMLPWDEAFASREEPVGEDGGERDEDAWRARRLSRALAGLPAEQREAVVLFEIDGFSIEDVAAMQDASVPAVKSRLVRGRERLRRIYERWGWRTSGRAADAAAAEAQDRCTGTGELAYDVGSGQPAGIAARKEGAR
jgi:RNA polymerase sigma-70 factor (ECF subfamily)